MPNKKLVVLSGSGISVESGLATFRDAGGLWEGHNINDVASAEGWRKNPERVLEFYNLRRKQAAEAHPNDAHKALVQLEQKFDVTIITQNVDDLHERAGSSTIIHLHGMLKNACSEKDENLIVEIGKRPISIGDTAPDGEQLRPAIVWFGELVPMMEVAAQEVSKADYLIVIGTSLAVYPAASLLHFSKSDAQKFIIDPAIPVIDNAEEWWIIEDTATNGVPELVQQLISIENP